MGQTSSIVKMSSQLIPGSERQAGRESESLCKVRDTETKRFGADFSCIDLLSCDSSPERQLEEAHSLTPP